MKSSVRGLATTLFAVLFGSAAAQNKAMGPSVGDVIGQDTTIKSEQWFCDLKRIVGCEKSGHVCRI